MFTLGLAQARALHNALALELAARQHATTKSAARQREIARKLGCYPSVTPASAKVAMPE